MTRYAQPRLSRPVEAFARHFVQHGKPIAAICHGPWALIEAGGVKGRKTKTDLSNAGASWVDETVVRDGLLVTSRKPEDVPAFNPAMIALFGERREQRAA